MAAITNHGGKHHPKKAHDGKKGPALLQRKTSGETRQDYEGGVGYGNMCNNVKWPGNKEDWH